MRRGCEVVSQRPLECPQEGSSDGVVVRGLYSVTDVPLTERPHGRGKRGQVVQSADDDRDHLHEQHALLTHLSLEEPSCARLELEQPTVEQDRRRLRLREDLNPGRLNDPTL